jgi:hypothetical protein
MMLYVDNRGFAEGSLSRGGQRAYRVVSNCPEADERPGPELYAASGFEFANDDLPVNLSGERRWREA